MNHTTMNHKIQTLDQAGLESVYDALATAIDRAGAEKQALFLVKLALLNANVIGDEQIFRENLEKALLNL